MACSMMIGCTIASAIAAQDPTPNPAPVSPAQQPNNPAITYDYQFDNAGTAGRENGDYYEFHYQGGFRLHIPKMDILVRGENLLILNDLEAQRAQFESNKSSGLPKRGIRSPEPRRRLSPAAIRGRLERALSAIGRGQELPVKVLDSDALDLFRYLYCEGKIIVVQGGVEVLQCDRMWISPIDDRVVVENAELRYITETGAGKQSLVVRGPRLVKQGGRWVGTDLLLTTCDAAKPHAALAVKEAEIIERPGEFEVISRGQTLQIGGTNIMPLPDARIFTGSQSEFPIKRVTVGYSGRLGAQTGVLFGLPWNTNGGALHHWITGRPADEFRGEWELGVGYIEARGIPLEGALTYGVKGLYEGRIEGRYLDDSGTNLREIRRNIDETLIENDQRSIVRTSNRVFLNDNGNGQDTHLDLVAFYASDAAAYSEFLMGPYRYDELPETSTYLHHADGNHLLTVGTRFNLSDFSYRDDRYLADRFIEELPVVTYQWLAQPLAETPWETPIVVDIETQVGQRRSDYDDRTRTRTSDRTLRADQLVEFSAPFQVRGFSVRPYVSGRGTFYDDTPSRQSEERIALEGGIQIGTRFSRTWSWMSDNGKRDSLRHVVAPLLTYRNRYKVNQQPDSLFQYDNVSPRRLAQLGYDSIDLLSERELVRFEVRNLWQKMAKTKNGQQPRDVVSLDFAQDLLPNSSRDNRGEELGLFYYDLLFRPDLKWLPFENFAFALYGDVDWERGMQTLDTELQFGKIIGVDWTVEYREDLTANGAVAIGGRTKILDRWDLYGSAQRDLERSEWLAYVFGIRRNDHDWSIALQAAYNPFVNETTFRIDFQPSFGGRKTTTRDRFGGNDVRNRYAFDY